MQINGKKNNNNKNFSVGVSLNKNLLLLEFNFFVEIKTQQKIPASTQ